MTDEKPEKQEASAPQSGETKPPAPPKLKVSPTPTPEEGATTSRIDLESAIADTAAQSAEATQPSGTIEADMSALREAMKKSTVRIDTEAVKAADKTETQSMKAPPTAADLEEAAKKSTVRIDAIAPADVEAAPAPADLAEATKKSTVKIDAAAVEASPDAPPSDEELAQVAKKATARIEASADSDITPAPVDFAEAAKKATVRIDALEEVEAPPSAEELAQATKKSTVKIDPSATSSIQEISPQELEEAAKKATIRIDDAMAQPKTDASATSSISEISPEELEEAAKKATIRIDDVLAQPTAEDLAEATKKSTVKIDTVQPDEIAEYAADDITEAAKKATTRVQIDEDLGKGDTQRVDAGLAKAADGAKKQTSKIDITAVLDEDEEADIFKRRTAVLDSSKLPGGGQTGKGGGPRTIRIKRPGAAAPTTTVLKKLPNVADAPTQATAIPGVEDAKKSETSRIDLPPEATVRPPTRRKTVRIKRPDGTSGSRQLNIARPSEPISAGGPPMAQKEPEPAGVGAGFCVVALLAMLVVGVLLYVLAAQTVALDLPWPGRMV